MEYFTKESDFENAVITALKRHGWAKYTQDNRICEDEQGVLYRPTEDQLIDNWAQILSKNNQSVDRLNGKPLIREEMDQLLEQIQNHRTPLALNNFINGGSVSIIRKNPEDTLHFGKEVSLKIFDRNEIAGGKSRYQIAEQPLFPRHEQIGYDRRGDLMLLINGMPIFHIELKRSGIPVLEAVNQIRKYSKENVFTGLFALVQIFVAMNPDETLYFANPGPDGNFNPDFYFHWADSNNEPINNWKMVIASLLSIPMAHQLLGFYTVADDADGILKVMRSYQYYAANKISDRVTKQDWDTSDQRGGYIWHTTGSGKTMTSFKSAQLIANSGDADKVVFLMDRIELGTQSLREYRAFADNADDVQGTKDTLALISKLKSTDPKDTLIVSSIQKMSNIKEDAQVKMREKDLEMLQKKRLVFIIDECHRSTFGEMLTSIKQAFPKALFFGFTGTPVFKENEQALSTTADIFGNELHRYSISDGIRDKNVLGFDPTMVMVYRDKDIRKRVALQVTGASSEEEALSNPSTASDYLRILSSSAFPMAGSFLEDGNYQKGVEDYLPKDAWETDTYQEHIVRDILDNWPILSRNGKFHAIFAVDSIPDAIRYYRKFKAQDPSFKLTCLFNPEIDNTSGQKSLDKLDGLKEILEDYNAQFGQNFDMGGYGKFKKDVSARLAHKTPYTRIPEAQQLNLLIVVNMMLTGFDSKWINTLYLDKVLVYQHLIQAFSRTNRLFNINEKPFGSIRYYRKPHTMKQAIESAVKLYSGDQPRGLFADHLIDNLRHMNIAFEDIVKVFHYAGVPDMEKLPDDFPARAKFAQLFRDFSTYLQAARIQGFVWSQREYVLAEDTDEGEKIQHIRIIPTYNDYLILDLRYKELCNAPEGDGDRDTEPYFFPVDPYLVEMNTGAIDNDYMNSRFEKWRKQLLDPNINAQALDETLAELHRSFAFLPQEEQRYAELFLHDVETGDAVLEEGKTFRDYITQYAQNIKQQKIHAICQALGCSEKLLEEIMQTHTTQANLNAYGRFDDLKESILRESAAEYLAEVYGKPLKSFQVLNRAESILTDFILSDGEKLPEGPKTQ